MFTPLIGLTDWDLELSVVAEGSCSWDFDLKGRLADPPWGRNPPNLDPVEDPDDPDDDPDFSFFSMLNKMSARRLVLLSVVDEVVSSILKPSGKNLEMSSCKK